jgi:hypothetical protein
MKKMINEIEERLRKIEAALSFGRKGDSDD